MVGQAEEREGDVEKARGVPMFLKVETFLEIVWLPLLSLLHDHFSQHFLFLFQLFIDQRAIHQITLTIDLAGQALNDCILFGRLFLIVSFGSTLGARESLRHNRQQPILESEERREVKEKTENSLPDVLLCRLERLSHNFIHLLIEVQLDAVLVEVLPDFFLDLALIVLRKVHQRVPVAAEAVLGQGPLHLLRVEEVEVGSKEFSPDNPEQKEKVSTVLKTD